MVLIGLHCGTNLSQVVKANNLTDACEDEENRQQRQHIFTDLAPIAIPLALRYLKIKDSFNFEQANQELFIIHKELQIQEINL